MQLLYLNIIILIAPQFHLSLSAMCITTSNYKNYTCVGFRFKQAVAPSTNRRTFLRVSFYNCKETEILENSLAFPNVENLTVSCDIQNIHPNAFHNMNHLKGLNLGNNMLSVLPENLFHATGELQALNLSHNTFEELTQNLFKGLNNLKQLNISYNKISQFHVKVFDNIQQLEEIYLNNNEIGFIPGRLFNKLRRLRYADLSFNHIKNLYDEFVPTHKLTYLNLSHNVIEGLSFHAFHTTNLEVLDLSYNRLVTIYQDSFRLDLLRELYLSNNKITFVEFSDTGINKLPLQVLDIQNNMLVFLENDFIMSASNLITLKLEGNPWDCKCLEKLELLRQKLSLDISINDDETAQSVCIIGNANGCNIDKNNLTFYYNIFQQLDL